jgi:hypothetical protein
MTSFRFLLDDLELVVVVIVMPVTIQWQNSDHFGSSRDGASGSVMARVNVGADALGAKPLGMDSRCEPASLYRKTVGSWSTSVGEMTFPRLALLWDCHFTERSS